MILAGHPRPTGASLHTGGNTPPAPQIVIFRTRRPRPGHYLLVACGTAPAVTHCEPITEFAPEPMIVAGDTRQGLADAASRRQHEADEVRQIAMDGFIVIGKSCAKLARLLDG